MPVLSNHNPKSLTLILIGYSIIQILLFTTLQTTSIPSSPHHSYTLFQISLACQTLLLLQAVLAVLTVTYHTLIQTYRLISFLFIITRFLSVICIFWAENKIVVGDEELRNCLEVFSIGVGVFEILIVYSQIKMVRNVQSVLI